MFFTSLVFDSRLHPRSFDHCIAIPNCQLGNFQALHTIKHTLLIQRITSLLPNHPFEFASFASQPFSSPLSISELRHGNLARCPLALNACNTGNFHVQVVHLVLRQTHVPPTELMDAVSGNMC